jgi:hypothetical protein
MTDSPVAETSTLQPTIFTREDIHVAGGIRTHDPSRRSAADLRLRPRGHCGRRLFTNSSRMTTCLYHCVVVVVVVVLHYNFITNYISLHFVKYETKISY